VVEDDDDQLYFQGAAARKQNAVQRRGTVNAIETLNKELEDVVDAVIKADKFRIFT